MILSTQLINKNWMPVTSVATSEDTTSLAGATAFTGKFGVLSGISSTNASTLEYTAILLETNLVLEVNDQFF